MPNRTGFLREGVVSQNSVKPTGIVVAVFVFKAKPENRGCTAIWEGVRLPAVPALPLMPESNPPQEEAKLESMAPVIFLFAWDHFLRRDSATLFSRGAPLSSEPSV